MTLQVERARRRRRVTVVLLLVGLGCGASGLYARQRAAAATSWMETAGEVVDVQVNRASRFWHVDVNFSYRLSNQTYLAHESRLLRGDFDNDAAALSSVAELAPGSPVRVFYDPERPDAPTLKRQAPGFQFLDAAAILWLSLALLWFLYDRAQGRE